MVNPDEEGIRIYQLLYDKYNPNFGGSVVGISGAQGSVKTSVCLDLVEKKIQHHPEEIIFWRETLKSPLQCERLINSDYQVYIEEGYNIRFKQSSTNEDVDIQSITFKTAKDVYKMAQPGILNVIFFKNMKSWTELIAQGNMDPLHWKSVFIDEMEGIYYADANNQTTDKWWDWMHESGDVIKECRKGKTSVFGNYHDENLIDYRIKNKFMFYMYGYGAIVNASRSRILQSMVDACAMGQFCIAHGRSRFGKIQVATFYPAKDDALIPYELI